MKRQPSTLVLLVFAALAACGQDDAPAETASAAKTEKPAGEEAGDKAAPRLHVPDACSLLAVRNVASISGWKGLKMVPVDTQAEYLSACNIIGADPKQFVKIAVAVGGDEFKDSQEFAQIMGDRSGTLLSPAKPVTNLGVPVIEMDGGPEMQAMQARTTPYTELTITTPSMQLTRALFPQALIALRKQLVTDS
jgi:hypothetical protein